MDLALDKRIPFSYLREIGLTIKRMEHPERKSEVEKFLIDHVASGDISIAHDISKYSRAIAKNETMILDKMARNRIYTAKQAMEDTGVDVEILLSRLRITANYMTNLIDKTIETKAFSEITHEHMHPV